MNMKPIVAVAIALTVGIVTFSGVLIPAIESGVNTEDTFSNVTNSIAHYKKIGTTENITWEWDHTDPLVMSIDGDTATLPSNLALTVSTSGNWLIRFSGGNTLTFFPNNNASPTTPVTASVTDGTDMSISFNSGTMTVTNTAETPVTRTITYTELYVMVADDDTNYDYVMKSSTQSAYMNGDSPFYASGMSVVGGQGGFGYTITGSIDDGATISQFRGTATTNTDTSVNYTEVSGYKDLYKLDSITFKANTTNMLYNYFLVPTEVTAEKSVHADATTILLFQTIPVFIVLGMIVAVVGVLYLKSRR